MKPFRYLSKEEKGRILEEIKKNQLPYLANCAFENYCAKLPIKKWTTNVKLDNEEIDLCKNMIEGTVNQYANQNDLFRIAKKEITDELYPILVKRIKSRKIRERENREKIIKKYPEQINLFR